MYSKYSYNEYTLHQYDEDFWKEFLYLYRNLPELWQTKHPKYTCRCTKERAYQILAKKLKEVDHNASIYLVKAKIQALRSYYRKEVRKIQEMAAKNQKYYPGWMYHALKFISAENNKPEGERNIYEIPKSPSFQTQGQIEPTRPVRPTQTQNIQRVPPNFTQNQHFSESEIDRIVTGWFYEFGKLPPDQKIFAKKAIYNILFEGQLCSLHKNSVAFHQPKTMVPPTLRHMSGGACFPRQSEIPTRNSTPEFQTPQHPVPIERSIPPGPEGFQSPRPVPMPSLPPRPQSFQTPRHVPMERSIPQGPQNFQTPGLVPIERRLPPGPQKGFQTPRSLPMKRSIRQGPQSFQTSQPVIMERNLPPGPEGYQVPQLVLIDQSIPPGPQKGFQTTRPVPMEQISLGPEEDFQEEILGLPGIAEIDIKMEGVEKDPLETVILEL